MTEQFETILNLNDEFAEEDLECLSEMFNEMIRSYEASRHTEVAYLLFTGKFESRYDEMFSSEGGQLIPYSNDCQSLFNTIVSKLDNSADTLICSIEDSVFKLALIDHDGTITTNLTLITSKFAESKDLEDLFDSYSRKEAITKLMGTTQPKGTAITKKMQKCFC